MPFDSAVPSDFAFNPAWNQGANHESAINQFTLKGKLLDLPATTEALQRISLLHQRAVLADAPEGLLITGQPGSGKTTILLAYAAAYPDCDAADRTRKRVLYVAVPAAPTVKNLAEAILIALGDPAAAKGTTQEKTQRIYMYLVECGVEVVLIDEFQHFFDQNRRAQIRAVTDWLKLLIDHAKIAVVLAGLPRAAAVVQANAQLARRFSSKLYLRPFSIDTRKERNVFRGLLKEFGQRLPLPSIKLHENNVARRFYFATAGLIDYVIKILERAVLVAAATTSCTIDQLILAQAYVESIWPDAPPGINPFLTKHKMRRLDKTNEPFEHWEEPGKFGKKLDLS